MIRFRVAGIPIEVHPSHLVIAFFIALVFGQGPGRADRWPATHLLQADGVDRWITLAACVVLWFLMIVGSILAHELGHALMGRKLGHQTEIHLLGLGGLTRMPGADSMPWHHDVLFTMAGPGAGLVLANVAGLIHLATGSHAFIPSPLRYVFEGLFLANLAWSVMNLLPVASLDGGRVVSTMLIHVFGARGFLISQVLSLGMIAMAAAWAISRSDVLFTALLMILSLRSMANIRAYFRGEIAFRSLAHPNALQLQQCEALVRSGRLEEAAAELRRLIESKASGPVRDRSHVMLGLISLRKGDGKSALEHFAMSHRSAVPVQAQAAALALVNDDASALPLWVMAARRQPDESIMTEWAATLLRLGRENEARQVPGARFDLACQAAERVHTMRG